MAVPLIVSHDRFLLDRLVCKIVEIRDRKADVFTGNYSTYRQEKEKRDIELGRQYEQRLEFVEKILEGTGKNLHLLARRKNSYPLFECPFYSLALASKIADIAYYEKLDIVHAHYAIPHNNHRSRTINAKRNND